MVSYEAPAALIKTGSENNMGVKTKFAALLGELARREGKKRISTTYISRELPLAYKQAARWRKDQLELLHVGMLSKSLIFFHKHGMKVTFNDMLEWTPNEES